MAQSAIVTSMRLMRTSLPLRQVAAPLSTLASSAGYLSQRTIIRTYGQNNRYTMTSSWLLAATKGQILTHANYCKKTSEQDSKVSEPILAKLFPQTSPDADEETKKENERREQEESKENERSWSRMKIGFYLFGLIIITSSGGVIAYLGQPEIDKDGSVIEDGYSKRNIIVQYIMRSWNNCKYYKRMIEEPSRPELLPDPLAPPYYQPPYTLVLGLKDILVHPEWTYNTGWRFKKRPGIGYFLKEASKDFEIVVFTTQNGVEIYPLLDSLDPERYIMYRLMRDATHFIDGYHVKNLDHLNRPLEKVIVIEWDKDSVKFHPDNALIVPRWDGNDDDKELYTLLAFLKTIVQTEIEDVREVLGYYRQFEDPLAQFRENQRILDEQLAEKSRQDENKTMPVVQRWARSLIRRP